MSQFLGFLVKNDFLGHMALADARAKFLSNTLPSAKREVR